MGQAAMWAGAASENKENTKYLIWGVTAVLLVGTIAATWAVVSSGALSKVTPDVNNPPGLGGMGGLLVTPVQPQQTTPTRPQQTSGSSGSFLGGLGGLIPGVGGNPLDLVLPGLGSLFK